MEKFIEVHDNFLPLEIENYVENLVSNPNPLRWSYYKNSTTHTPDIFQPGFNYTFFSKNSPYYQEPYYIPLLNILYTFCNYRNILLTEIYRGIVWLSVPSPHPSPEKIHTDMKDPHYVFIYYINDSDGDTILFDDNNKEIKRVSPKKGRGLLFDGSLLHCGSQPFKNQRLIINYNFYGNFYNK
jgi:hypothetical protein